MRGGKLVLEGFTRFRTPVEIDLDEIGPGVVAVTGPNGAGKTTIMEASGPGVLYREFPYRSPSGLQYWSAPEGGRILRTFHHGGKTFEAEIRVGKDGTQSAFLKIEGERRPLVSGKVREYDAEILRLMGPKAAFLAGNYGVQGGDGRFGSLGVSDRKALFRYYLGLERTAACHKIAKKRLDDIDGSKVDVAAGALARLDGVEIPDAKIDLETKKETAKRWTKALQAARDRFAEVAEQAAIADLVATYNDALDDVSDADAEVETILGEKPEGDVEGLDLDEIRSDLVASRKEVDRIRKASADLDRLRRDRRDAINDHARACKAADTIGTVPCGGSGKFAACRFLKDAIEAKADVPRLAKAEEAIHAKVVTAEEALPDPSVAEGDEAAKIARLEDQEEAARDLAEWSGRLEAAQEAAKEARTRALDIRKRLPKPIPEDLPTKDDIEALRAKVSEGENQQAQAVREEADAAARLARLKEDREKAKEDLETARTAAADYAPLQLLTQALGPNGIQALEIDAAGPRVSTLANDLLRTVFGSRFTMEVRTQKEYADARRAGEFQEDFSIRIYDDAGDIENTADGLGGGERVIVDEALRNALALFARERAGSPIETLWRDEVFARLYPPNDLRYVDMLRRVREIGNFWQALYVADETEAKAADAEIHLTEAGEVIVR